MDRPGFEYVGFWARVLATLIDTAIVSAMSWPFLDHFYDSNLGAEPLFAISAADVWSWVLPAVGIIIFWMARQATPGKMAIRARIVDATTGGKPSPRQLLLRYLGYYVSMIPLFAGFLWAAFDPRKQGWHDKMANTVVIRPVKHVSVTAP
jgi:uncharacterized RDD family membrane protein YckC